MDLKQKFKDLLNFSKEDDGDDIDVTAISCSIEEFLGLSETEIKLLSRDPESNIRESRPAPVEEQEILDTVEAAYVDDLCDGGRYQLEKLQSSNCSLQPDESSTILLSEVRRQRQLLGTQLGAVTHKLFSVILQKQSDCSVELAKVLDLQDELDMALGTCCSGRLQVNRAKQNLTLTSLGLLAHHRRRHHLLEICKSLKAIHTLEKMGQRVQELLQSGEEDYAAAIQLLVEGRRVAETYKHFSCVAQLTSRLQDTLEMAEEQLDVGLSKCCQDFDPVLYKKLQMAFTLLGKQSAAIDQLNLHLSSGLHQRALTLVKTFTSTRDVLIDYSKLQFQDLCKHVNPESFMSCLQELCTCLWNITVTYHKIHHWHCTNQLTPLAGDSSFTDSFEQKLLHGRIRLWQDVQNKTRTFLLSSDLWHFSIDEFLHVLDVVDKLMEVGKQFCGSDSEILRESVRQQSINYFRSFHRGRLDELRVFLENESWEHCPVRSNFNVFHLAEFHFLNHSSNLTKTSATENPSASEEFYSDVSIDISPFSKCSFNSPKEENIMITTSTKQHGRSKSPDNSSENAEDSEHDYGSTCPPLANTTLSVLRLFGRYIHFMQLLKTIAFDVLICLNQLFDFYLYTVYQFFGTHPADTCDAALTPKLRTVLNRIGEMLILEPNTVPGTGNSFQDSSSFTSSDQVPCPQISPVLEMNSIGQLFGLELRLVAAESVVFLAEQMELLRPNLLALIPPSKVPSLQQFFTQTMAVAQDLRLPIYTSVACRCLDSEQIVTQMSRVQWEIKEVMSQHSHYVEVLLQSLSDFNSSINRVCHSRTLPPEAYNILWDQLLRLCYRTLLDGFSTARKCTNEGRALMQLDLRQFQLKVEGLTRLRPLPDAALVETYIKAFYLPESSLDQWVRQHTEYSPRHLMTLLQCVGQANKKTRLSLTALMEELDLSRR